MIGYVKDFNQGGKIYELWLSKLKNGGWGKKVYIRDPDASWLRNCDLCGLLGGRKKVTYRSDVYGWDTAPDFIGISKCCLCVGCWNKARAIYREYWEAKNAALMARRCQRLIGEKNGWRNKISNGNNTTEKHEGMGP